MALLQTHGNQSLVSVVVSVAAVGVAAFYLHSSSRKNRVMTASATSSQVLLEKYDVFISFRGPDIRQGFLSHLTKRLRQKGIDVYVDERLESGDEISSSLLEAIERSMIALVIFSEDYASSRWCLEELVKIMECKRVNNQIVIPVFYKMDPSHVRHQKGSYADEFARHKKEFDDDSLQVWRSALRKAANLSGLHSSKFHNESDLIDGIIKDISKRMKYKGTIEPKRSIGFEETLATALESFMQVDSQEEVGVVGIWGKGGMGKTTFLAGAVFDKFSRHSFYFVSNVREQSKSIIGFASSLGEKILSVLPNMENLTNTQKRLHRIRVLLVLDDIDPSNQLQDFMGENLSLLGPGSKVIITSRNKHVLVGGRVHEMHEVKDLYMEETGKGKKEQEKKERRAQLKLCAMGEEA